MNDFVGIVARLRQTEGMDDVQFKKILIRFAGPVAADIIESLLSRLEVTENAPDGIECRDMTIKMLEKRIQELEAERAEREKQEPVARILYRRRKSEYLSNSVARSYAEMPEGMYPEEWNEGEKLYAAPPVTAPVRLTDEQIDRAFYPFGASANQLMIARSVGRAVELLVLRANGFKVED